MKRCVWMSLLAALGLGACNPSPAPVSYFEPMSGEQSYRWFLPLTPAADHGRANQAAGTERLAALQGPVDAVKYRMLDRYSAFMLSGDVSTGTPFGGATFETLQIPASPPPDASGERPERTVSLMDFEPQKWTSFRVYNRGACSSMQDWQDVAQGFGASIADQLNDDPRITHASVTEGLMSVMLRSEFPSTSGAPDDRDRLGVRAGVHIERLQGGHGTDCRDLTFDVHFTVELEHTDRMQLPVQDRAFAVACRLGDRLTEYNRQVPATCRLPGLDESFWLDPARTKAALGTKPTLDPHGDGLLSTCAAADANARVFRNRVIHQAHQITSDVANGRVVTCDARARMLFSLGSSDWSLRRHRELSGRGASHDPLFLLGLATMNGHDLGAHDTLARVLSVNVENFHDGPNGNCNPGPVSHVRKRNIIKSIKGSLRDSLPLGLNAAFMAGAVQDPGLAEGDTHRWRVCSTDADCDFRAGLGPAFEIVRRGYPPVWRGARHVCRPSPDTSVCPPRNANCSFCAAQLEIDRINVRPDGLEVVLEDDVDLDVDTQDPQASFELFANPLARGQVCRPMRPGLRPTAGPATGGYLPFDSRPDDVSRGNFSFPMTPTGVGGATLPAITDGP